MRISERAKILLYYEKTEVFDFIMKKGKAVGPDELQVEVWKCMGEMGIKFLTRLFNKL